MTNAVAVRPEPEIITLVEGRVAEIEANLPADMPSARFVQTFKSACRRDPQILKCTANSVTDAVMRASADGLMLDGREAALVVRKSKIGTKDGKPVYGPVAVYTPMFMGLMKRARNSGEIAAFQGAFLVYEKEIAQEQDGSPSFPAADGGLRFRYRKGDDEHIYHDPFLFGPEPGPVVGAYSIVRMKDGTKSREFMTRREIDAVRRRPVKKGSDGKEYGENPVWATDFEEMAKKTVIRRHCKKLPMDSDLARIFDNVDRANGYGSQDAEILDETPPPEPDERASKKRGGASAKLREAEAEAAKKSEPAHDAETGEIQDDEQPEGDGETWFE